MRTRPVSVARAVEILETLRPRLAHCHQRRAGGGESEITRQALAARI